MSSFPVNDTTTYSTINYNASITRIMHTCTIIHLYATSLEIAESFVLILNGMGNAIDRKLGNIVKKNKDFEIGND